MLLFNSKAIRTEIYSVIAWSSLWQYGILLIQPFERNLCLYDIASKEYHRLNSRKNIDEIATKNLAIAPTPNVFFRLRGDSTPLSLWLLRLWNLFI